MDLSKLINVTKPARYIGGEINSFMKDDENLLKFCLIFPDIYEIGTSHVGYRILYELINKTDTVYCERFYAPWKDAVDYFKGEIFVSLETHRPLKEFDVLGFSFNYEMSYTTALSILKHSNIPIKSSDRIESDPLIIAGGSCCYNPGPLIPFMDAFYIGEGDINFPKLLEEIKVMKDKGMSKAEILEYMNTFHYILVPSINRFKNVRRDVYKEFNKSDTVYSPIVPAISSIQDRVSIEIARGCTAGCRFCQAGMIYRPVRERDTDKIMKDVENQVKVTGFEEASLLSLSTGDFSQIEPLVMNLNKSLEEKHVSLSTPSLRANSVSDTLFKEISKVRKSGFTIAPEAGSQRMRNVINKNITEKDILTAVRTAALNGYTSVKLYFMIGLPFETDEDILGIADVASKIRYEVKQVKKGQFDISVSVSHFVPKCHTPFQRIGQVPKKELERRMFLLKDELKLRKHKFKFHDTRMSVLEAFLSRGGDKVAKTLEHVVMNKDFYLDSWDDFFDYNAWIEAGQEVGVDIEAEASYSYADDEIMPWSNISTGVTDKFYKKELERAKKESETLDCRDGKCAACGVCDFKTLNPVKAENVEREVEVKPIEKEYEMYEVIYRKFHTGVYFSALDLSRLFTHSFNLCNIELAYSQGFNPHPKISTWIPLSIGIKGEEEVMNFESVAVNMDTFLEDFNKNLPVGIQAISIKKIDNMKPGTDFVSTFQMDELTFKNFMDLYNSEKAVYYKLDKKGREKEININSFLKSMDESNRTIDLKASNDGSFNLIEILKNHMALEDISITRLKLYREVDYNDKFQKDLSHIS